MSREVSLAQIREIIPEAQIVKELGGEQFREEKERSGLPHEVPLPEEAGSSSVNVRHGQNAPTGLKTASKLSSIKKIAQYEDTNFMWDIAVPAAAGMGGAYLLGNWAQGNQKKKTTPGKSTTTTTTTSTPPAQSQPAGGGGGGGGAGGGTQTPTTTQGKTTITVPPTTQTGAGGGTTGGGTTGGTTGGGTTGGTTGGGTTGGTTGGGTTGGTTGGGTTGGTTGGGTTGTRPKLTPAQVATRYRQRHGIPTPGSAPLPQSGAGTPYNLKDVQEQVQRGKSKARKRRYRAGRGTQYNAQRARRKFRTRSIDPITGQKGLTARERLQAIGAQQRAGVPGTPRVLSKKQQRARALTAMRSKTPGKRQRAHRKLISRMDELKRLAGKSGPTVLSNTDDLRSIAQNLKDDRTVSRGLVSTKPGGVGQEAAALKRIAPVSAGGQPITGRGNVRQQVQALKRRPSLTMGQVLRGQEAKAVAGDVARQKVQVAPAAERLRRAHVPPQQTNRATARRLRGIQGKIQAENAVRRSTQNQAIRGQSVARNVGAVKSTRRRQMNNLQAMANRRKARRAASRATRPTAPRAGRAAATVRRTAPKSRNLLGRMARAVKTRDPYRGGLLRKILGGISKFIL